MTTIKTEAMAFAGDRVAAIEINREWSSPETGIAKARAYFHNFTATDISDGAFARAVAGVVARIEDALDGARLAGVNIATGDDPALEEHVDSVLETLADVHLTHRDVFIWTSPSPRRAEPAVKGVPRVDFDFYAGN